MSGVPGLVGLEEKLREKLEYAHGLAIGLGDFPSLHHAGLVELTAHDLKVVDGLLDQIVLNVKV